MSDLIRNISSLVLLALLGSGCHEITSVLPNPAPDGEPVTIIGTGFGDLQGASVVLYDGETLTVASWSDTQVMAILPQRAGEGSHRIELRKPMASSSLTHTIYNHPQDLMVWVPPGDFRMGAIGIPLDEQPIHRVYLDGYWIDETEVTVSEYRLCVEAGSCTTPFTGGFCNWNTARQAHPVNCVDWFEATAYCEWVGKRLPTEAEWEKAARGTDARTYSWGEQAPTCDYAVMDEGGGGGCGTGTTAPVGSKPMGASPYGVLDLTGSVYEWTSDWYGSTYYSESPASNPTGPPSGLDRTLRGGSWFNSAPFLRASKRFGFDPWYGLDDGFGIRCAKDA